MIIISHILRPHAILIILGEIMKVLVPVKHVIDYNVQIQIKDGKVVKDHVKHAMNPFDEIAVEAAIQLKEQQQVNEVHCISIGSTESTATLRHGLALGADTATLIETTTTLEPLHIAQILKTYIELNPVDLVIMGKQAIDDDANQAPQMLAALLNWPQATFASKIKANKKCYEITREVDGGLETLQVQLPAIISTDLRLNEPRFATLPNIMKAKSKPFKSIPITDLKLALTPYYKDQGVEHPPQRKAGKVLKSIEALTQAIQDSIS